MEGDQTRDLFRKQVVELRLCYLAIGTALRDSSISFILEQTSRK